MSATQFIEDAKRPMSVVKRMFLKACRDGNHGLVDRLIAVGADSWDEGFYEACFGGHLGLVQLIDEKRSALGVGPEIDYEMGLYAACRGARHAIVRYLIDVKMVDDAFGLGLEGACRGGHVDVATSMIIHGGAVVFEHWLLAIVAACKAGSIEIVEMLQCTLHAQTLENYQRIFTAACAGGSLSIVNGFIGLLGKHANYDEGLVSACRYGRSEIVELMIDKHATNWGHALMAACRSGVMKVVVRIVAMGATQFDSEHFDHGLWGACRGGHSEVAEYMITLGASDWDLGLFGASVAGHEYLMNYMRVMKESECVRCVDDVDHIRECLDDDDSYSEDV